jgi:hypothetical protein
VAKVLLAALDCGTHAFDVKDLLACIAGFSKDISRDLRFQLGVCEPEPSRRRLLKAS